MILSACGTAAILNTNGNDTYSDTTVGVELSASLSQTALHSPPPPTLPPNRTPVICSLCHVPYADKQIPFSTCLHKCALCSQSKVPDILLASIELPAYLPTVGLGCLIQARVFRHKKDTRGEQCAKELSDVSHSVHLMPSKTTFQSCLPFICSVCIHLQQSLPFLEYEVHKQLLSKLKMKGMNALFGLNVQISVGENMVIAIAVSERMFNHISGKLYILLFV